jgi:hypothetical protein
MSARVRVVAVYQRCLPTHMLEKEPWRKELLDLLVEFASLALWPTPYGLRQVAEVLLELREIMLLDGLDHPLTGEAMHHIRRWVEEAKQGRTFDLVGLLRDLREMAERIEEGWEDEC